MPSTPHHQNKKRPQISSSSSPDGEFQESSSSITLELIHSTLMAQTASNARIESTLADLSAKIETNDLRFQAMESRIAELERTNRDLTNRLQRLEIESSRCKVRISGPLDSAANTTDFKSKVLIAIKTLADFPPWAIRDSFTSMVPDKYYVCTLFFNSAEFANLVCRHSFRLFKEFKIRVGRELTPEQRKQMMVSIDAAKEGKENPVVKIHWSTPAAFVDGVCVWPKSAKRRFNSSYADAALGDPNQFFSSISAADMHRITAGTPTLSHDAPDLRLSKFIGFLVPWNGAEDLQHVSDSLISDGQVPFSIEKDDNAICAGVSIIDGKITIARSDGGERTSSARILRLMADKKIVNAAIIIFRKYGGYRLGAKRFHVYNGIAATLIDRAFHHTDVP